MLAGYDTFGQTGNQLRAMYRDVEYTCNNDMSLGLMRNFWAIACKIFKTSELSVLLVSYGFGRWKMIETDRFRPRLGPYRRIIAGEVVICRSHLIFSKGGVNKNPF